MPVDDNTYGWIEYKRMIIDWHNQELEERKAIKTSLEVYQEVNRKDHQEIMKILTTLTTEKEQTRRWVGPAIAALVAAIVSGAAKAFGF